jgi:hypothetical protein
MMHVLKENVTKSRNVAEMIQWKREAANSHKSREHIVCKRYKAMSNGGKVGWRNPAEICRTLLPISFKVTGIGRIAANSVHKVYKVFL